MELALIAFMTQIGFTLAEILKMLVLVGLCICFQGALLWKLRKPIRAFYEKFMTTMDSLPKLHESVDKLNNTMQDMQEQTNERLNLGEDKFQEHSREIRELAEKIDKISQLMSSQFKEVSEQIRYLQTRNQIGGTTLADKQS